MVTSIMDEIQKATALQFRGDRPGSRAALQAIWDGLGAEDAAFYRCILAHYLADVQDDLADELDWDRRALAAAEQLNDAEVSRHQPGLTKRGLMPSLHLNLADGYHRQGDLASARHHILAAQADLDALGDDGYGKMIRGGIERLAEAMLV